MKRNSLPLLGAHMSIVGGFDRAVHRAADVGCDCVQLFTASPQIWPKLPRRRRSTDPSSKPARCIPTASSEEFVSSLRQRKIQAPIVHGGYLINLASPDNRLWKRSIDAFILELQRASELMIPNVVLHPGAYTTSTEQQGFKRIIQALDEVHAQTRGWKSNGLLETTAGQGSNLGHRFEHLAIILDGVQEPDRLGVCLDTCHLFAAGYSLSPRTEYRRTIRQLETTVGIDLVQAIHLNDSKTPAGSRRDRHEHIGRGYLGLEPFRYLLNDRRFRRVPMYLETPKGKMGNRDWDKINLQTLRSLTA
jgi:deoxyribonuclease-4